jgi:cell division protein FtsI (penicillin-binding protein 3)
MNNPRVIIVIIMVILCFALIISKLIDIQIINHEEYKYIAERQQTKLEKIRAERGLIYDRNNSLLVYNRNDISFYVDLRMVSKEGKKKISEKFSSVFGKNQAYYKSIMSKRPGTVCIEKKAPSEKALALKNFKIAGLFYREDPTRIYNYNRLASHLLGFVNYEYRGVAGIEASFEDNLKGEDGIRLVEKSAIGDMVTVSEEETKPPVTGDNLILTIDKTYQQILEEELSKGLQNYEASSAIGIIMNPNNGDILALACQADYDPNNYWEFSNSERRNRTLTDTYEPGSTFKPFVLAAMLDENICRENEIYFVENGRYKYRNAYINDTHKKNYLTVKGIIEWSSNIGMAKLVQKIDNETFYKYMRGFGFGNYTSIELPGEAKGLLKKPDRWSAITKTFMSFGYELSVTPVQIVTAFSALINGGVLYYPQIIKEQVSNNGEIIFEKRPVQIRKIISNETSSRIKKILTSVVEKGTGQNAKIDFIAAGGKTGTAQKLIEGNYSNSEYNSSFIGFFPAEHPQAVCLILINSPKVGKYGGLVAAPIFKEVAEKIVKSDPDQFRDYFRNSASGFFADIKEEELTVNESLKNFADHPDNSEKKMTSASSKDNYIGDIHEIKSFDVMPDLTNYNLRNAILVLSKLGIDFKINGSGKIVSQSIQPGVKIRKGITCELVCRESEINGTVVY